MSSATSTPANTTTPANASTTVNPRSVRFNTRTRVFRVLHLDDMTQEEIRSSYVTEEDTALTQRGVVEDIRILRTTGGGAAAAAAHQNHCARGLERFVSALEAETAKNAKLYVIDAVLDEQDLQDEMGIYDGNQIAAASRAASRRALERAQTLAATDEAYVNLHVRSRPEREQNINDALMRVAIDESYTSLPADQERTVATSSNNNHHIRRASDLAQSRSDIAAPGHNSVLPGSSSSSSSSSPKNVHSLGSSGPTMSLRSAFAGSRRSSAPPSW